jgi:hypothetical protein
MISFAQKVWISIGNYALHSDLNVTLSEAKGLKSGDRFFAPLRMTFWARPLKHEETVRE